ncbi:hypothetical protein B0H13DRAFT_2660390 [Mycena leptocephala]|nr:hypothetical protein B0H13DRAFT_2660390 [Mycena leptocephala]
MTVLINGRDEPHVVFDTHSNPRPNAVQSHALRVLPTAHGSVLRPAGKKRCVSPPLRASGLGGDVPFLVSASSGAFTTDLVPVLSMTKLADACTEAGGGSCFADMLVPGKTGAANPTVGTSAAATTAPSHASGSWTSLPYRRTGRRACYDCDAGAIRSAYNITGESVPREEAYQYKYLLDFSGNTFSGR